MDDSSGENRFVPRDNGILTTRTSVLKGKILPLSDGPGGDEMEQAIRRRLAQRFGQYIVKPTTTLTRVVFVSRDHYRSTPEHCPK